MDILKQLQPERVLFRIFFLHQAIVFGMMHVQKMTRIKAEQMYREEDAIDENINVRYFNMSI